MKEENQLHVQPFNWKKTLYHKNITNHRSVLYKSKVIRQNIQQMCPTMFWGKVHPRTGHKDPEVE